MRLFLAFIPSPFFRERLSAWQEGLHRESPGCRPEPPERIHMTLLFVGEGEERERKSLEETGERLCQKIGGRELPLPSPLIFFDSRSLPGLGILSFSSDLPEAAPWTEIREILKGSGQGRPFWPHMTLFRRFFPIRREIRPLPETPDAGFSLLVLFESLLEAGRSVHRPLRTWPLGEASPRQSSEIVR